jgi:hypothetical protein
VTNTATANNTPPDDVSPPPGAEADIWEGTPRYRMVFTPPIVGLNSTGDPLRSPIVTAQAVQWADGTLDVDGAIEPPSVCVEGSGTPGLTVEQARQFAMCILHAAAQVEAWVTR